MDAIKLTHFEENKYTIEDIYNLPEETRAELIDGELFMIVDSEKSRVTVYNFENGFVDEYSFSDKVKAGIYEDFEIDFSEISLK